MKTNIFVGIFYMQKALVCSPSTTSVGKESVQDILISRLWYLKGKTVTKAVKKSDPFLRKINMKLTKS